GDSGNAPGARFAARLEASLLGYFGKAHAWPRNWTDAGPFQNCYWFRNPNYPAESIIRYDGRVERDFIPEKVDRIRELKQGFLSLPEATAHFRDPARAFDEALRLNDGGIAYLAEGLAEVCKPDLKFGQVSERLTDLRHEVRGLIAKFYMDLDVEERLKLRRAAANRVFDDLESVVASNSFGSFLSEFLIDETDLTDVVYATLRGRTSSRPVAATEPQPVQVPAAPIGSGRFLRPGAARPAMTAEVSGELASASSTPVPQGLERERLIARACLDAWISKLMRLAESPSFQNRYELTADSMRQIVDEKLTLIRRIDLETTLAGALKQILLVETAESSSPKAALVASKHINRIVGDLGFGQLPPPQRPEIDAGDYTRRAFADRPVVNDARGIGVSARDFAADYATDWFFGFLRVVEENVQNPHDLKVDLRMNAQLKTILDSLSR
ncbi:MAG: srfC, partial [Hyphomicrobiales bacterium]|nr:srfC [Hyphomicrobiales bacterium]